MTLSVQLGVLMAAVTAFASIVGFLLKHRGAVVAPPVELRHPVRSTADLFRSPVYAIGCVVATTSWGFHVAALALAPISIVQSVIAGGLVLLTVTADRVFGQRVTRREWIGVALTAAGLAFLAATLEGTGDSADSAHDAGTLAAYIGLATLAGMALVPLARRRPDGIVLAVSAGFLWGASDVSIKAISAHSDRGVAVVVHPPRPRDSGALAGGKLPCPRDRFKLGPVVAAIAVTSATANIFTIASGPIVFGEPLPDRPLGGCSACSRSPS